MSMETYTESLEESDPQSLKKKHVLSSLEMKKYRKITGNLMWLAENVRMDLLYGALQLSMKNKEATVRDMKKANALIKKAKSAPSLVVFTKVREPEDLIVHALSDASYTAGEKAVGGQVILVGSSHSDKVTPIYWKSKLIKQVCHSPKDAETRNLVKTVDILRFLADQLSYLMFGEDKVERRVKVKVYSDSKATLDSIASTHQIEQRMLRSCIADLKQKLEEKDIESYEWLTDDFMVADILTKEKKSKEGVDDIVLKNHLPVVNKGYNLVVEEDGEFLMKNPKMKEKKFTRTVMKS